MRKYLFVSALAISSLAYMDPAGALPTGRRLRVFVESEQTGSWEARNRVAEDDDTCEYVIRWSENNRAPLGRTVRCNIVEFRPGNDFDCEINRRNWIDSLVELADSSCRGFDDFGQVTDIDEMVAGESRSSRRISGVIEVESVGDLQSILVRQ